MCYMKKYILFIFCLFLLPLVVNANSVSSINMDIYIDNNGNAFITETWNANLSQGTEGYHPYYNLGEAYISDINVSMDGHKFETVSNWNINNSFSEKAYKAGLYKAGDGEYDICFGISEYGTHKYSISYKINNYIVKLNDADMLYWNLFPKDFNGKIIAVGNSALKGAAEYTACALSGWESESDAAAKLDLITEKAQLIELAAMDSFDEDYINAMNF